jgi:hypothetical protein
VAGRLSMLAGAIMAALAVAGGTQADVPAEASQERRIRDVDMAADVRIDHGTRSLHGSFRKGQDSGA